MTKILKLVKRHVKKDDVKNRWYYQELDKILDILFQEAVNQNISSWSQLSLVTKEIDGIGVCYDAVAKIGERITRRPQLRTVMLIAAAVNMEIKIKPRSRSITLKTA